MMILVPQGHHVHHRYDLTARADFYRTETGAAINRAPLPSDDQPATYKYFLSYIRPCTNFSTFVC